MKRIILIIVIAICSCALVGCTYSSQSPGEKAAEEVITNINSGNMEKAKERLLYYGDTLQGQDYLDFCDALERAGVM